MKTGTYGNVMLRRRKWLSIIYQIQEKLLKKRKLLHEFRSLLRLIETNQSRTKNKSNYSIAASKMLLSYRFRQIWGWTNSFTQDFTHKTRQNTNNTAINKVENQIKLSLELTRKQDKLLQVIAQEERLSRPRPKNCLYHSPQTSNRLKKWTC